MPSSKSFNRDGSGIEISFRRPSVIVKIEYSIVTILHMVYSPFCCTGRGGLNYFACSKIQITYTKTWRKPMNLNDRTTLPVAKSAFLVAKTCDNATDVHPCEFGFKIHFPKQNYASVNRDFSIKRCRLKRQRHVIYFGREINVL